MAFLSDEDEYLYATSFESNSMNVTSSIVVQKVRLLNIHLSQRVCSKIRFDAKILMKYVKFS